MGATANGSTESTPRAVTIADFCRARTLSVRTGWSLVSEGKLKVGRIGKRVVVYAEDAAAFDAAARDGRLAS